MLSRMLFFLLILVGQSALVEHSECKEYVYDDVHRLLRIETASEKVVEYTYDSMGNRLSKVVTINVTDSDGDGLPDDLENGMCTDYDDPDTDDDGILDGGEDLNHDGVVDPTETDPCDADTDGDGLQDGTEDSSCTNPLDADTDDDGLSDGDEDVNHNGWKEPFETDPCDADTDDDGLQDGTESGDTDLVPDPDGGGPLEGTDPGSYTPDADPASTTNPLNPDTDGDGELDGTEDSNHNGQVDSGEGDPNVYDGSAPPPPWHMPERLTLAPNPGESFISQDNSDGAVAADSANNVHLVYKYVRDDYSGTMPGGSGDRIITQTIYYLNKTGGTWATPVQVYTVTQTTDSSLIGYRSLSGVQMAVDSEDHPHVAWIYQGAQTSFPDCSGFNGHEIYYTSFNGSSWEGAVNVSSNATKSDLADIAVDSGDNVHLVWSDGVTWSATDCSATGTNALYHRVRFSNGSWSGVQPVSATDHYGVYPAIDAGQNGEVHLLYAGQNQLEYAYWDGAVWSTPEVASAEVGSYYYVDVAVAQDGDVHGVYAITGDFGAGWVYEVRHLSLEGLWWSGPETVSLSPQNGYAKVPAVEVDSHNNPQILWWDNENYRILYRQKTSAGWSSAVVVNTDTSRPDDKGRKSLWADMSSQDALHVGWQAYFDRGHSGGHEVYYNYANLSDVCVDYDEDGYGDPGNVNCPYPERDCDDTDYQVNPGAFEGSYDDPVCSDLLDNDCDGLVDEMDLDCASSDAALIPGGCYIMGDAFGEGAPDEQPQHNVCISAFEMDIHEVTNSEYDACVDDGGCTLPSYLRSYTRPTYYGDPGFDDYPVIFVSWLQASEYCEWEGKRLPTEAEAEYAARGGLAQKRFAWGGDAPNMEEDIDCHDANYGRAAHFPPASCIGYDGLADDTHEVGRYAPNGYGLFEITGNVYEWTRDWYQSDYYDISPVDDPAGPAGGAHRVMRGGSWVHNADFLRVAKRSYYDPAFPDSFIGFRCVRPCAETEVCNNGVDDDCNGLMDEEDPACQCAWDLDGDGDVDGTDLNMVDPQIHDLAAFALEFGLVLWWP